MAHGGPLRGRKERRYHAPPPGRSPSRGFYMGMGAVALVAVFLAVVGLIASRRPVRGDVPLQPTGTPIPVELTVVPPKVTPDPDFTRAEPANSRGEPSAAGAVAPRANPTVSTIQSPLAVASSWSMAPLPVEPAPAPPPQPAALRLARQAQERLGINIVLEGQDWGADESAQETNIAAVISAVERLPERVISATVGHPHGPLTFLSNRQGRTLGGWQPYGDAAMAFYTNSDQGPWGHGPANQVILIPGSAHVSVGHEVLHAYQFREVGPDQYVLAMLGEEMRSFARATGWRQVGSDEEIRAAADKPWDAFNSLFVYEGRPLTYTTAAGATVRLDPRNPLEAFALAGSIYYTRPPWTPPPDWPEYWAWFREHLGEPRPPTSP